MYNNDTEKYRKSDISYSIALLLSYITKIHTIGTPRSLQMQ